MSMTQLMKRVSSVLLSLTLLSVPLVSAQTDGATADTSFDEPMERPENPGFRGDLALPELPDFSDPPGADTIPDAHDTGRARALLANYEPLAIDPGSPGPIGPRPEILDAPSEATSEPRVPSIESDPPAAPVPQDLNVEGRWPGLELTADSVVSQAQVIAYYGHPFSRFMGILGENPIEVMTEQLRARAAEYDAINGSLGVAPAFHIIYGTVYEDASIGILREFKLLEYIEFARANDVIVFLDHQIGDGTVDEAIRTMLPYLRYENVHLAIDPEWATDRPGEVIGGVHADDINHAQQLMQDYLEQEGLPGTRMLVVHQFNYRMIDERELVRSDFPRVRLIHHADGFGSPPQKRDSFRFNAIAGNMPLKGFKLFYPKSWRDGGYDVPLMSPAEVMQLDPVPVYIQYQ